MTKLSLTAQSSTPTLSLPDDLVLNIVARVPRLYYPTLSLVSKSFRSLLASPELYNVRSLEGHTESCLYVWFNMYPLDKGPTPILFTLCRKPDQILTKKEIGKSSGYALVRVPIPHPLNVQFSSLVSVGSDIYNIGESFYPAPSSSVSILDCRSHTWREAPSLPVELLTVSAGVLDGKIYVAGRSPDVNSDSGKKNSFEVFDIKTQVWDSEPIPRSMINGYYIDNTACIDGKFNVVSYQKVVAYDPKEGRWDLGPQISELFNSPSYCEIDNVLYSAAHGAFTWYDSQVRHWRDLKGFVGLPTFSPGAHVRLADYGGKMVVMWDVNVPCRCDYRCRCDCRTVIWCAEIALERLNTCEIWGKVEWVDRVLTVLGPYSFVKVIAATV